MEEIFRGTFIEAMNIRNLLENYKIEVFVFNEFMSNIEPWVVSSGGSAPVILSVNEVDFIFANNLIEDYNKGILSL